MTIHAQRLERLAVLLDEYAAAPTGPAFDLDQWATRQYETKGHLWWKRQVECGTTACAVGLACLSGEFASDGLKAVFRAGSLYPVFAGRHDWGAVEELFGITPKQADRLFSMQHYEITTGPKAALDVAARIRTLIARRVRSRGKKQKRTTAAVEQIKARALEPELTD